MDIGTALIADREASITVEPGDRPFDDPAAGT
jgi:hypothetical protein